MTEEEKHLYFRTRIREAFEAASLPLSLPEGERLTDKTKMLRFSANRASLDHQTDPYGVFHEDMDLDVDLPDLVESIKQIVADPPEGFLVVLTETILRVDQSTGCIYDLNTCLWANRISAP